MKKEKICPHCNDSVKQLWKCINQDCINYGEIGCINPDIDDQGSPKCLYMYAKYVYCRECRKPAKLV